MASETMLPLQLAKEFHENQNVTREAWCRQVQDKDFQDRFRKCPRKGRYAVTVEERAALNVDTTYRTRCSIHGSLEDLKKALGAEEFERVRTVALKGYTLLQGSGN
jgi:hypothetical protein